MKREIDKSLFEKEKLVENINWFTSGGEFSVQVTRTPVIRICSLCDPWGSNQ